MAYLGAERGVSPGYCEIRLPYKRDLSQPHSFFHGGRIGTIGDSADANVLTEGADNFGSNENGAHRHRAGARPHKTDTLSQGAQVNEGAESIAFESGETGE